MWKTKDGRLIPIRTMTDSHINNAISFFKKLYKEEVLLSWNSFQSLIKEQKRRRNNDGWDE